MNKPSRSFARPLSDILSTTLRENFARQGFASSELVTRWADIAGPEIAAHSEPIRIQWPRQQPDDDMLEPATLILRVEGPASLEVQHSSAVILERVNRFFGWQAIGRIALRQAPLKRREAPSRTSAAPDPKDEAQIAASLPPMEDDDLKGALVRLGVAIKRK